MPSSPSCHPVTRLRLGPPVWRCHRSAHRSVGHRQSAVPARSGPSADDVTVCGGQPQRVVVAVPRHWPPTASTSRAPMSAATRRQRHLVLDGVGVGENRVQLQLGRVRGRTSRWCCGEKPAVSPVCVGQVQRDQPLRRRVDERGSRPGTSRCGITTVNQEPGPRTPVAPGPPSTASGRRAVLRGEPHRQHPPRWWRPRPGRGRGDLGRVGRVAPDDVGLDVERLGGHRQHPAARAEQPAGGPARRRVAEQLQQGDEQQVADRVPGRAARRRGTGAGDLAPRYGPSRSSPHSAASAIRRSPGGSTPTRGAAGRWSRRRRRR